MKTTTQTFITRFAAALAGFAVAAWRLWKVAQSSTVSKRKR